MSKITYHKNCFQHEAVTKAKRMLKKINKQYGGFQGSFYCDIKLTGVNDIDRREVKHYIERHLENLKKKVEKELLKNQKLVNGNWNEEYEEGFFTLQIQEELDIAELLNQVHRFIWDNYPELDVKKSEYVFSGTTPEQKYNEVVNHYKNNPAFGFCQEYFAVLENGATRQLYPITFSAYDLTHAKSVYVQFLSPDSDKEPLKD